MPPRIDHRKPVVAFAVLLVVAAAVIGINLRANALPGRWLAAGLLSARGAAVEGTLAAPGPPVPARTGPGRSPTSRAAGEVPLARMILDGAPAASEPTPRPARTAMAPSRSLLHRPSIEHRRPGPAAAARRRPAVRGSRPPVPPGLVRRDTPRTGPHGRGPVPGLAVPSAGRAVRGLAEHPGLGGLVVRR